ncbi:hypothetical protein IWZ01DRAFT_481653 [Phyllosticta capitalensis]
MRNDETEDTGSSAAWTAKRLHKTVPNSTATSAPRKPRSDRPIAPIPSTTHPSSSGTPAATAAFRPDQNSATPAPVLSSTSQCQAKRTPPPYRDASPLLARLRAYYPSPSRSWSSVLIRSLLIYEPTDGLPSLPLNTTAVESVRTRARSWPSGFIRGLEYARVCGEGGGAGFLIRWGGGAARRVVELGRAAGRQVPR